LAINATLLRSFLFQKKERKGLADLLFHISTVEFLTKSISVAALLFFMERLA